MKQAIIILLLLIPLAVSAQNARIQALLNRGMAFEKNNQLEQANHCYRQIAAIYDSLANALKYGNPKDLKSAKQYKEMADQQRDIIAFNEMRIEEQSLTASGDFEGVDRCYNRMIAHLNHMGWDKLASSIKGLKSTNLDKIGIRLMQAGRYAEAMTYMDSALVYTQPREKNYKSAHRWKAHNCEIWGRELLSTNGSTAKADSLFREAEKHFTVAESVASALKVRNSRAAMVLESGRYKEALDLYGTVVKECASIDSLANAKSEALYHIGEIQLTQDKIPQAIESLQQAYELAASVGKQQIMLFAADKLSILYRRALPDSKKEEYWRHRADQLRATVASASKTPASTAKRFDMQGSEKELERKTKLLEAYKPLRNKKYDEAVEQFTALIAEFESQSPIPFEELSECYSFRATAFMYMKHFAQAETDKAKAIELVHKSGQATPSALNSHWYTMTIILFNQDKKTATTQAADSCIHYALAAYGPMHIETLDSRSLKANIMAKYGQRQAALDEERQCLEIIRHNTQQNYLYLTRQERANYWDKLKQEGYNMATFAYNLKEWQSQFTDEMFNQQLLAKGLLLNTDRQLKQHIDSSPELKALFARISALRHKADSAGITRSAAEAATMQADQLERSLTAKINNSHADFSASRQPTILREQLTTDVDKLKKRLQQDQAAIEFIDFRTGKDSVMYGALLLTPQEEHVRFIPLFEQRDTANLRNRLWTKLQQACGENTQRIYFAASGMLHLLPIESYPHSKSVSLYRLSSTRMLAEQPANTEGRGAVIYGGIRYDATLQEMADVARTAYPSDSSRLRYAMQTAQYLEGTLEEARTIANILDKANQAAFKAEKIEGVLATETTFKNLDGQRTRIIHIATHGYYNNTTTLSDDIDAPLRHCGLLFAGANNTLEGEAPPDGVDDGILTATEIADLDLSGLELAVLSACETGKGNITSDGVFGLQRAFKKAGAHSIIMSLWKVDDDATKELMSQFYSNWTNGMSKHKALECAKNSIRTTPRWSDPKYWAAFILLDAIE